MILGLGIDSIEINRFAHWHSFSEKQLRRLFSAQEIAYCLSSNNSSAERFAARFATREAFFKAFQSAYPAIPIPFLSLCRTISVERAHNNSPSLRIDWPMIHKMTNNRISGSATTLVSITHTRTTATALVLIQ